MTEPPHDADAWQRNYETKLAEIEQRNERMQQELDDVEVTERSSDGAISVTVNSQGNLTDLQLADVLRRRDGKSVSEEVLRLVSTAQGRIADKVQEVMDPYIGGTQAMDHVMGKLRSATPTTPKEQAPASGSSGSSAPPPPQRPSGPAGPPASGPPSAGSQGPPSGSQPSHGGYRRNNNPWDDDEDFSQGSFLE